MMIGILTMHKVLNYGSALQAYATQQVLSQHGYKNELIDYLFPSRRKQSLKVKLRSILKREYRKKQKFHFFWESFLKCSPKTFSSRNELNVNNCQYDIYLTGSDQVWNPILNGEELPFMFDFIPSDRKKLAYAASFSKGSIPKDKQATYRELLSQYKEISVREASGVNLLNELAGIKATHVCDPTLLLDSNQWSEVATHATIRMDKPYILAYILSYAYNPFPHIFDIINKIQNELGFQVVLLDGKLKDYFREGYTVITSAGPADFLYLIRNASFVVTTSFHGTVFATNFRKPFVSVIQSNLSMDSRMYSFVKQVGLEEQAVIYDRPFNLQQQNIYTKEVEEKIERFKSDSLEFLQTALRNHTESNS